MDKLLTLNQVSVSYTADKRAVNDVSTQIAPRTVMAIMGPSGCGKSTLLRAINRMHDLYPEITVSGKIFLGDKDMLQMDTMEVRRRAGMVFQRPNPFPTMSIADNVLAGYKLNGIKLSKDEKQTIVEQSLQSVALWDEVKDNLHKKGSFLSGGQQQRLCIARAVALKPDILLMDEPTSALDPISSARVEDLITELKAQYTVVVVTHNLAQAARISDKSMFMFLGECVEQGDTKHLFTNPQDKRTQDYLTGVFS